MKVGAVVRILKPLLDDGQAKELRSVPTSERNQILIVTGVARNFGSCISLSFTTLRTCAIWSRYSYVFHQQFAFTT